MKYLFYALLFIVSSSCSGRNGENVEIVINPGLGARQTALMLESEGIISSATTFLMYMRLTGDTGNIRAGTYRLRKNESIATIRKKLISGPNVLVRVSVPEGFTSEQIAARLHRHGIIGDEKEFIDIVVSEGHRGFLFPDTYDFFPQEGPYSAINKMRQRFDLEFTDEYRARSDEKGMTVAEVVTLASIIEREARVPEERPVISDIFHKRLKIRMYLESCATIQFALGERRQRLTYADLEIDSPYNTYRNFGLPPTPICNPGGLSIRAALYPEQNDYLFFFALDDGSHVFSSTYQEHLRRQGRLRR